MDTEPRIHRITREVLTPFVRKALGNSAIEITEWKYRLLHGSWTWPTRTVCRIFGRAKEPGEDRETSWSLILKIPRGGIRKVSATLVDPWQREALFYQSGLLSDLPGGVAAPRCLGVVDQTEDEPWIWLEDVKGELATNWPLARYVLAARHLGQFQGAYLAGRPLPSYPWLDRRGWLRTIITEAPRNVPRFLEKAKNNPLVEQIFNPGIEEHFRRLYAEREVFIEALCQLPTTLCHWDTNTGNFISRRLPDGTEQTVVLDWDFGGLGTVGHDIAHFIACSSSLIDRKKEVGELWELKEPFLEAYLKGVKEAGWKGDPRIIRFGCSATLGFLHGMGFAGTACEALDEEGRAKLQQRPRFKGRPISEIIDGLRNDQDFFVRMAEEARALLRFVRR